MKTASKNSLLKRRRAFSRDRNGSAAIEVAFCVPVLFLVTLLLIEFTNALFLQQSLKLASYEGVRVASKQGATLSNVDSICQSILDSRRVVSYQVSVDPEDFTNVPRGTLITVTLSVDKSENRLFGMLLGDSDIIEVLSFGLKE